MASTRGVFRRKPVEQIATEHEGELERTLGLWQLTAIGVGGIIGAGIFALAGAVANEHGGPGRAGVVPHRGGGERRGGAVVRRVRRA